MVFLRHSAILLRTYSQHQTIQYTRCYSGIHIFSRRYTLRPVARTKFAIAVPTTSQSPSFMRTPLPPSNLFSHFMWPHGSNSVHHDGAMMLIFVLSMHGPPQRFRHRLTSFSGVLGFSVTVSTNKKCIFGSRGCAADFEFSVYFEIDLTREKWLNSAFFEKPHFRDVSALLHL